MKKFLSILFGLVFVSSMGLTLTGCGDTPPETSTVSTYSITVDEGEYSDYYNMSSNYRTTKAGTTVTVTFTYMPNFLQVEKVYANAVECVAGSEANTYTFTMPESDVVISADMSFLNMPTAEYDMCWENSPSEIHEDTILETEYFYVDFGSDPMQNQTFAGPDGYAYLGGVDIISTNQEVIPSSAISLPRAGNVSGMYARSMSFSVDTTGINVGQTTLIVVAHDNHSMVRGYCSDSCRAVTLNVTVLPAE